ncbi:MAG: universal stress protein [Cyclobacteriaceae bacterium]|nr:universal stress protein [Cyclobacteriaceae bacterium]
MIRAIGVAIAFSPTAERMLAEAAHLAHQHGARLVLIHAGHHTDSEERQMRSLMDSQGLKEQQATVRWETGEPARAILKACDKENVDLLVAGALVKEDILHYYLGTIARHIMRRARCSVLLLTQPSLVPRYFKNIVVDAEEGALVHTTLSMACQFGKKDKGTWLHVVRELKLYGLAMSASDQCSEEEYDSLRHDLVKDEIEKVESLLQKIPHEGLKVNIKVVSGKSGFELAQFAKRKQADLLVVSAPPRRFRFFDRVFTHDLEYVFADLPCNLLIVHPGKEVAHA